MEIIKKPLAIYVHIPFCVKKCNYCDFLSGPADATVQSQYIDALLREIHSYRTIAQQYKVSSIFIGGGTPSVVDAGAIEAIMRCLNDVFGTLSSDIEVTIEINPGSVTKDKLRRYYAAGINRISFGLQSANNEELRLLGRIHTFEQFVDNYHCAREVGFQNINIDLMSALPGQTKESYEETLQQVLALSPEHISSYSLIIEEGTPFYDWYGSSDETGERKQLPSEEVDREMYEMTKTQLQEYGYERYEISNYAKHGYECKHNITYWKRGDYLGIGTGAASLLDNVRHSNERDLATYITLASETNDSIYQKALHKDVEVLSTTSQMEEFIFLGLRMMEGVNSNTFYEQFGYNLGDVYGKVVKRMEEQQLIEQRESFLALTERGIDVSNYVMSEFLLEDESYH